MELIQKNDRMLAGGRGADRASNGDDSHASKRPFDAGFSAGAALPEQWARATAGTGRRSERPGRTTADGSHVHT